jgi:purine-binding chemotaxis protein CheW
MVTRQEKKPAFLRHEKEKEREGKLEMAESAKAIEQTGKGMADKEGKYLTFSLAGEEYGIGILKVKEIIGMMPITTVPRTPGFLKGVINLRGKVIPVVDLRLKFGMEEMSYTERTCIIVAEMQGTSGPIQMGIVVDSVSEVLNIKGMDVEETPAFGAKLDTDYILGMAKMNGGVKILLDIDKVLSAEETGLVGDGGKTDTQ